ncbi:hypothetical protein SRABI106_01985 [Rahnella aquatilis]|nr:hypothetical protein SRABI106_01985 [Rahnella aquatilis]
MEWRTHLFAGRNMIKIMAEVFGETQFYQHHRAIVHRNNIHLIVERTGEFLQFNRHHEHPEDAA